jgi:hypothetical protein
MKQHRFRPAGEAHELAVDELHDAGLVADPDQHRGPVCERPEALLAVAQFGFHRLAQGDIPFGRGDGDRLAILA